MCQHLRFICTGLLAIAVASTVGCAHWAGGRIKENSADCCSTCGDAGCRACEQDCAPVRGRGRHRGRLRSAINRCFQDTAETLPLGSTVRAHYQAMETNAEAADFILYRRDFVGQTDQLTPEGRDKILEIAVRMKTAPFPVLVERSENNSTPELDSLRRDVVARLLMEYGTPDADCRTVVSPSYGPGYQAIQAERTYSQHLHPGGDFGSAGHAGELGQAGQTITE